MLRRNGQILDGADDNLKRVLQLIEEGTAAVLREHLFPLLVRRLAAVLEVECGFVSELTSEGRARTISLWNGHRYEESFDYLFSESPHAKVLTQPGGLLALNVPDDFPNDDWVRTLNAKVYASVPMFGSDGMPLGHLGVLHEQPLEESLPVVSVLRVFAARAASEIERAKIERELVASETQYRTLAEGSPDVIYRIQFYPEMRVGYVNPAVERVFGYERGELYENAALLLEIVDEAGRDDMLRMRDGKVFHTSVVRSWSHKDGSTVTTEQHNTPIYDAQGKVTGMVGVARDVSSREAALRALRESEERQSRLVGALPDLMLRLDEEGNLLQVIPTAAGEPSPPRMELVRGWLASRDTLAAVRKAVLTGAMQELRWVTNADADDAAQEFRFMPMPTGEVLALVRDITPEVWSAAELERRAARDELHGVVEREVGIRNPYGLTFREFAVLHLVATGAANKEIANRLGITHSTVDKHVSRILGKMNAGSRTEAGVRAIQEGLVLAE